MDIEKEIQEKTFKAKGKKIPTEEKSANFLFHDHLYTFSLTFCWNEMNENLG